MLARVGCARTVYVSGGCPSGRGHSAAQAALARGTRPYQVASLLGLQSPGAVTRKKASCPPPTPSVWNTNGADTSPGATVTRVVIGGGKSSLPSKPRLTAPEKVTLPRLVSATCTPTRSHVEQLLT